MIRRYFTELLSQFRQLVKGGLFYIFGSSVISQVGGLLSSFLVIRHLSKAEYGGYVSANNLYSYVAIFVGLGMGSAILQFCSEHVPDQRKHAIYYYGFLKGSIFNVFLIPTIWLLALFKQQTGGAVSAYYLKLMCGIPLASFSNTFAQTVLRIQRRNMVYAYVNIIYTLFTVFGNVFFTRLWGVLGLIVSTYVSNIIAGGIGFFELQRTRFISLVFFQPQYLPSDSKRVITKYAALCALTNFTSTILVLLDVTCLDITLSSPDILADYKVAASLPSACMFIPSCLITYFYPYMVERFSSGKDDFKIYFRHLTKMFVLVNLVVFIGLMTFASFLITLLFGEKYVNVIPIFRLLCLNYFISASFHKLLGNLIAVVKAVHVNLIHTALAGGLNIILDLILIQYFGSIGAAIATVCITIFISVLEFLYFRRFFRRDSI